MAEFIYICSLGSNITAVSGGVLVVPSRSAPVSR